MKTLKLDMLYVSIEISDMEIINPVMDASY